MFWGGSFRGFCVLFFWGHRHKKTLIYIGNLADLLRATGALVEAEAVLGNAVGVAQEVFGSNHHGALW